MATEFSGDTQKPWKAANATEVILEYIYQQMSIVAGAAPVAPGGLATEAKQDALIAELIKMIDFEIHCVRDTTTDVVYLMNVEKNETTGIITTTYLDAEGNAVVPPVPGDLVVCDATAILAQMLAIFQGVQKTPSYDIDTTLGAGSVAAGARSVSIKNNGTVDVTVDGNLLPVGESIGWDAGGQGDTLGAISYNIPASGSIQILKVV